jgi:hypothetical protein
MNLIRKLLLITSLITFGTTISSCSSESSGSSKKKEHVKPSISASQAIQEHRALSIAKLQGMGAKVISCNKADGSLSITYAAHALKNDSFIDLYEINTSNPVQIDSLIKLIFEGRKSNTQQQPAGLNKSNISIRNQYNKDNLLEISSIDASYSKNHPGTPAYQKYHLNSVQNYTNLSSNTYSILIKKTGNTFIGFDGQPRKIPYSISFGVAKFSIENNDALVKYLQNERTNSSRLFSYFINSLISKGKICKVGVGNLEQAFTKLYSLYNTTPNNGSFSKSLKYYKIGTSIHSSISMNLNLGHSKDLNNKSNPGKSYLSFVLNPKLTLIKRKNSSMTNEQANTLINTVLSHASHRPPGSISGGKQLRAKLFSNLELNLAVTGEVKINKQLLRGIVYHSVVKALASVGQKQAETADPKKTMVLSKLNTMTAQALTDTIITIAASENKIKHDNADHFLLQLDIPPHNYSLKKIGYAYSLISKFKAAALMNNIGISFNSLVQKNRKPLGISENEANIISTDIAAGIKQEIIKAVELIKLNI